MNVLPSRARVVSWEQILVMAVAGVVGVYAGIAAGLFGSCIRFAQIALFRFPELWAALTDPAHEWRNRFAQALWRAHWHLEFAVLAVLTLLASLELPVLARQRRIPAFEAGRLRSVGLAGAFGLSLYYPLVLIKAFDSSFHDVQGGLFGLLSETSWVLRVLGPCAGALAAGLIIRYVSPASAGHGVYEVMEAIHTRTTLRGSVAFWKSVAAGLTIGSGGSAGREGPVVHLGGSVGDALARYLSLPRERATLLMAAGAGAGIAASFQAPLAGAMFAVEIILRGEFTVRGFAPIVLASVTASVTAHTLLPEAPTLAAPAWGPGGAAEIFLYLALGVLAGLVALVYVRAIDVVHDVFEHGPLRAVRAELKPALGGLAVGLLALLAPRVLGTGIETMNAASAGTLLIGTLLLTLVIKLLATALTLGSGAPGGSFFPAVFCGAMLGGAFGKLGHLFFPEAVPVPEAYAAVGMGAVVAGSTAAPLTGVLMMFELTGSHPLVLPLLVACGVAAAWVHALLGGSLYTLKLQKKGLAVSPGEKVLRSLSVRQALESVQPIPASTPWSDLVELIAGSTHSAFPVLAQDGRVAGILSVRDVRSAFTDPALRGVAVAGDILRTDAVRVEVDDDLESALGKLTQAHAGEALVTASDGSALGVLTREAVLDAWRRAQV